MIVADRLTGLPRTLTPAGAILVFLLAIGCVPRPAAVPPAPPGPAPLAVVTWNTDAGRGDLPRLVADLASGRLAGGPARDYVLLLQEVTEKEAGIAAGAGRPAWSFFVAVHGEAGRARGNAIVATRPLSATRRIDLPRERQPRAAAAAWIEIEGEALVLVSTHLENRLGLLRGLFADGARRRQVEALLAALPPDVHGILGGDLNTMLGPDEPALRLLRRRFDDTGGSTGPTFDDRLVLDHLFFDLPAGWRAARAVVDDTYGSDHHPVAGVVRID